jgi:glutathione S-transferase
MTSDRHIVCYHAPMTRSSGTVVLLEELKADYALKVLNMKAGEQRGAAYLAVNPMGKVPAITHNGVLVTEQGAIYAYLGDLYPEAGMTPAIGDPLRGPYLRWLFFYGSCFEPAITDKFNKITPDERSSPYGSYEAVIRTITDQLAKGPYLVGEKKTVADVLWSGALAWITMFGLVEKTPLIEGYIQRCQTPANAKVMAMDQKLSAEHEAAVKA